MVLAISLTLVLCVLIVCMTYYRTKKLQFTKELNEVKDKVEKLEKTSVVNDTLEKWFRNYYNENVIKGNEENN